MIRPLPLLVLRQRFGVHGKHLGYEDDDRSVFCAGTLQECWETQTKLERAVQRQNAAGHGPFWAGRRYLSSAPASSPAASRSGELPRSSASPRAPRRRPADWGASHKPWLQFVLRKPQWNRGRTGSEPTLRIQSTAVDTGSHWLQMALRSTLGSECRRSLDISFSPRELTTFSTFSLSLLTQTERLRTFASRGTVL